MTSCSSFSDQKSLDQRSKSCDTVCSSKSGCVLQRKKPMHPLATSLRPSYTMSNNKNHVKQRVLSAKLLKLRSLQSQINDANFHLAELTRENQALKILQQRQEKALSKYEGTNADLPRLLQSHSEEVRILSEKNKSLRKTIRDITDLVKTRDDEIISLKRQLDHLEKLNKNKHLGERQKLQDQVDDLRQKLDCSQNNIDVLNKKLALEEKSSKQKLNMENNKHKLCQKSLNHALMEIERLSALIPENALKNGDRLPLRKKISEKDLRMAEKSSSLPLKIQKSDEFLVSQTSNFQNNQPIKLKSLSTNLDSDTNSQTDINEIIQSPTEKVLARLSADVRKVRYNLDKNENLESNENVFTEKVKSHRPISTQKLDKLSNNIDFIIQKTNGFSQFDKSLSEYCNQVLSNVKNCSKTLDEHKESLEQSQTDTDTLKETVNEVKALDDELKKNGIISMDALELSKLLRPEKPEKNYIKSNKTLDKNENIKSKDRSVKSESKAKLLAALKAIDNGDSVDSLEEFIEKN